jgi:3-phenylpropionate/trans-cinnamate dioxygenase ferredoxin reductase subunit
MMTDQKILILGAGHGGGTIAAMLRQGGFGGDIVMIGEELVAPISARPI